MISKACYLPGGGLMGMPREFFVSSAFNGYSLRAKDSVAKFAWMIIKIDLNYHEEQKCTVYSQGWF